jgi:hypothetical protein
MLYLDAVTFVYEDAVDGPYAAAAKGGSLQHTCDCNTMPPKHSLIKY